VPVTTSTAANTRRATGIIRVSEVKQRDRDGFSSSSRVLGSRVYADQSHAHIVHALSRPGPRHSIDGHHGALARAPRQGACQKRRDFQGRQQKTGATFL
jgi:hypothetical protein